MANQGHAHGHAAATLDDLTVCVNRIRDTVLASFKLGQGGAVHGADRSTLSPSRRATSSGSVKSRLSSKVRRSGSSVDAEAPELAFGEPDSALYLATDGWKARTMPTYSGRRTGPRWADRMVSRQSGSVSHPRPAVTVAWGKEEMRGDDSCWFQVK